MVPWRITEMPKRTIKMQTRVGLAPQCLVFAVNQASFINQPERRVPASGDLADTQSEVKPSPFAVFFTHPKPQLQDLFPFFQYLLVFHLVSEGPHQRQGEREGGGSWASLLRQWSSGEHSGLGTSCRKLLGNPDSWEGRGDEHSLGAEHRSRRLTLVSQSHMVGSIFPFYRWGNRVSVG